MQKPTAAHMTTTKKAALPQTLTLPARPDARAARPSRTAIGPSFYQSIGRKGGETVKRERGTEFYAEIGRRGGEMRGQRAAAQRSANPAVDTPATPDAPRRRRPALQKDNLVSPGNRS